MTQIVGIHGIGQTYRAAPELETQWFDAAQGGLDEAGKARMNRDSFKMVFYGGLYRKEGTRAGNSPLGAVGVQDEWDKAMLERWWAESARLATLNRASGSHDPLGEEPTVQPPDFEGRGRFPDLVQRALKQLTKSRFFAEMGPERFLISEFRQVRRYLHDPDIRLKVQDRVSAVITKDTRIVIAHSLGSVVAYEALCVSIRNGRSTRLSRWGRRSVSGP